MAGPAFLVRCSGMLALIYGVTHATLLRWTSDDAFISFRYAQNLVDGLGLVYNPNEQVEGYTNFLWTLLVALGLLLGCDPVAFTFVAGILCYACTVILLVPTARRANGSCGFPIAAVGYVLHHHAAEFATSGLETALFTLLATAALIRLVTASRGTHYTGAGILIALTCLTRPDGVVIGASLSLVAAMVAWKQRTWQPLLLLAAPVVCLCLPYYVWRYDYYGYPFPNTLYVRSAGSPYITSGIWYLCSYLCYYFALVLAPLTALALIRFRQADSLAQCGWQSLRAPVTLACTMALFLAYVCWVGGDFMFARFCIPVTPALFLSLQIGLDQLRPRVRAVLGTLLVVSTFCSTLYVPWVASWGISEERDLYSQERVALSRKVGGALRESLRGVDAKVAIGATQAMLAYQAGFPIAIEMNGLTDEHIAHRRIAARGRVGHEKSIATWDDYLNEREVNFTFGMITFIELPDDRIGALRNIEFLVPDIVIPEDYVPGLKGGRQDLWVKGTMITYEGPVMEQLAGRRSVRFTPFDRHLDHYIVDKLSTTAVDELRADYAAFKRFYFDHTDDPERQAVFQRALGLDR